MADEPGTTTPSDSGAAAATTDTKPADALGDAGKAALDAERKARKAAEDESKRLQKIVEDAESVKKKADDEETKRKGEFEKLANERESALTKANDEIKTLTTENEALKAAMAGVLDSEWKELPAEVTDAFLGDPENPLERLKFLPKAKALATKLNGGGSGAEGNGRNPKGDQAKPPTAAELANEMRAARGLGQRR